MVEQMLSDQMLLRITGDPFWGDHCEEVAFNSYPAAVMPDFRALRYLTAPNMVVSDSKNHAPGIQNGGPFLVMSAAALLKENPKPSEQEVRAYLEGNICRCTGYHNIVKSIMAASGQDVAAIAAE